MIHTVKKENNNKYGVYIAYNSIPSSNKYAPPTEWSKLEFVPVITGLSFLDAVERCSKLNGGRG